MKAQTQNQMNDTVTMNGLDGRNVPSYYVNYTWIEPKDLVKMAKKQTQYKGAFPTRFSSLRTIGITGAMQHARTSFVQNAGAIVAGYFALSMIILSIVGMGSV